MSLLDRGFHFITNGFAGMFVAAEHSVVSKEKVGFFGTLWNMAKTSFGWGVSGAIADTSIKESALAVAGATGNEMKQRATGETSTLGGDTLAGAAAVTGERVISGFMSGDKTGPAAASKDGAKKDEPGVISQALGFLGEHKALVGGAVGLLFGLLSGNKSWMTTAMEAVGGMGLGEIASLFTGSDAKPAAAPATPAPAPA